MDGGNSEAAESEALTNDTMVSVSDDLEYPPRRDLRPDPRGPPLPGPRPPHRADRRRDVAGRPPSVPREIDFPGIGMAIATALATPRLRLPGIAAWALSGA